VVGVADRGVELGEVVALVVDRRRRRPDPARDEHAVERSIPSDHGPSCDAFAVERHGDAIVRRYRTDDDILLRRYDCDPA
jgi:hypothetical protein